jgi:hypothetical protein
MRKTMDLENSKITELGMFVDGLPEGHMTRIVFNKPLTVQDGDQVYVEYDQATGRFIEVVAVLADDSP